MTLKQQVLAGDIKRQTDREALARIKEYLTDAFILAALRMGRAGSTHDGYNRAVIGLTQAEERALAEAMSKVNGPIRHRIMAELAADGIAVSHGAQTLSFTLMGDPSPARQRG
jgi:hypothetical protein